MNSEIAIIGGGAAGFFCAANLAETIPASKITIFERAENILQKVKISGGGRCNVTHACFDPKVLVQAYPRGQRELLGPFYSFGPEQTVIWFENRGVPLKTESDGRMFPVSNRSQSIIDCLLQQTLDKGVLLKTREGVSAFKWADEQWIIETENGSYTSKFLVIASGSSPKFYKTIAENSQHSIIEPLPSLFTFDCKEDLLTGLSGVAATKVSINISDSKWMTEGPLLITHRGFSGPAILKLSALAARFLFTKNYEFEILINWSPGLKWQQIFEKLLQAKKDQAKKKLYNLNILDIPNRLWQKLVEYSIGMEERIIADIPNQSIEKLAKGITECRMAINGKNTFKEEFVTAGGVNLKEIDFKTFGSKFHPNLYFVGEVLDIDAITGGYNFQSAWTGAYLAAQDIIDKQN